MALRLLDNGFIFMIDSKTLEKESVDYAEASPFGWSLYREMITNLAEIGKTNVDMLGVECVNSLFRQTFLHESMVRAGEYTHADEAEKTLRHLVDTLRDVAKNADPDVLRNVMVQIPIENDRRGLSVWGLYTNLLRDHSTIVKPGDTAAEKFGAFFEQFAAIMKTVNDRVPGLALDVNAVEWAQKAVPEPLVA